MNYYNLLFDDLKLGNIVKIDNTYKMIDCSSIIEFSQITKKFNINNNSTLKHYDYYVNSNVLIILLKFLIEKSNYSNPSKITYIQNIIYNYYKNIKYSYSDFKYQCFNNIKSYDYINIPLQKVETFDNNSKIKKINNIEIKDVRMDNIVEHILIKFDNNYYIDMNIYYLCLMIKFNNQINDILYYLQQKININCLGTIIVEYYYRKNIKCTDKILKFISLCCLPFILVDGFFYINHITIDELSRLWNEITIL